LEIIDSMLSNYYTSEALKMRNNLGMMIWNNLYVNLHRKLNRDLNVYTFTRTNEKLTGPLDSSLFMQLDTQLYNVLNSLDE